MSIFHHHEDHGHHGDSGHRHRAAASSSDPGKPSTVKRALWAALSLTAIFAGVEAVAGWYAGSLALLSDAGHMLADAAALGLALFAQHLSRKGPTGRASYGYARAEILTAFINALAMFCIVVWIVVEAVGRLLDPAPVSGELVLAVAIIGLAVNAAAAWVLWGAGEDLNSRAALLHVFGDVLGSLAAITAGAVISFTGWTPIDPILSMVVAALILRSTWVLLRQSTHVLMEGVPGHLSYEEIGQALCQLEGVIAIHDLHVWTMASDRIALSAHVVIHDASDWPRLLASAQNVLDLRFKISHVTLQPVWNTFPAGKRIIPVTPIGELKRHDH